MNKRIAFFGTPDVTLPILESLHTHGYTPVVIVTNPDRPVGRDHVITSPPTKVWALAHNIPVLQPEKITPEWVEDFKKYEIGLSVVVAYGAILPESLINLPTHGTINVHYSLLPKHRGATPTEAAILHGDTETGVTIQQMVYKLDAGDIITQVVVPLDGTERTPTLRDTLNEHAARVLPETLSSIFAGTASRTPQNDAGATRCHKITKEDSLISLDSDPIQNDRKFRAYYGATGVYFIAHVNDKDIRVKVTDASLTGTTWTIHRVIPEGKKEMTFEDFKRGYNI